MKKITLLFLIVIFFPGVFIFVVQDAEADSNIPFQDDFNFSWTYQKIFGPADIPLPASMNGAAGGNVKAIYSPSVVKYNNKYLMFFGGLSNMSLNPILLCAFFRGAAGIRVLFTKPMIPLCKYLPMAATC